MTSLLVLTSDEEEAEGFEEHFEEVMHRSMADARIITGDPPGVSVANEPVKSFDAVYLAPSPKIAIYTRVFLESIEQKDVRCNLSSSSHFIMAKKHYLSQVLSERDVPMPKTLAISTEQGLTNVEKSIEFPVVAQVFDGFERSTIDLIKDADSLTSLAERADHAENVILIQEKLEGDLFDVLYVDGETVSLKIEEQRWELTDGDKGTLNYHSLSSAQEESVKAAVEAVGVDICRVRLSGDHVVDMDGNPDLSTFEEISGKDVYRRAAEVLDDE